MTKAGRKPLSKTGELMKPRQFRMTDAEYAKCLALGGAVWVRKKIKDARLSTSPASSEKENRP